MNEEILEVGNIKKFFIPKRLKKNADYILGVVAEVKEQEGYYDVIMLNNKHIKVPITYDSVSPRLSTIFRMRLNNLYDMYVENKKSDYDFNIPVEPENFLERLRKNYIAIWATTGLKEKKFEVHTNMSSLNDDNIAFQVKMTRTYTKPLSFSSEENPKEVLKSKKFKDWIQNRHGLFIVKPEDFAYIPIKFKSFVNIDAVDMSKNQHTEMESRMIKINESYEYQICLGKEQLTKRILENILSTFTFKYNTML